MYFLCHGVIKGTRFLEFVLFLEELMKELVTLFFTETRS